MYSEEDKVKADSFVLRLENVGKEYKVKGKSVKAVNDLSLEIRDGESFGIVGESGSGKSTVAKMITGITNCTRGNIYFEGDNITQLLKLHERDYRRAIQMVFQNPYGALNPKMKVVDIIGEPIDNYKLVSKNERLGLVKEYLTLVGLPDSFIERYPHQMSGGQCQRVAIARALVLEPKLLILDEATSALDMKAQRDLAKTLKLLQKERRLTYLLIGHDIAFVQNMCDRIAVLKDGRMVECGNSYDIINSKVAYTRELLKASSLGKNFLTGGQER